MRSSYLPRSAQPTSTLTRPEPRVCSTSRSTSDTPSRAPGILQVPQHSLPMRTYIAKSLQSISDQQVLKAKLTSAHRNSESTWRYEPGQTPDGAHSPWTPLNGAAEQPQLTDTLYLLKSSKVGWHD